MEHNMFRVTLDGRELARFNGKMIDGALSECFGFLHRHCPASVFHACKYEGYSIEGCVHTPGQPEEWERIEV